MGRSSAAGAANHRRVWGAAGYTTRSSPAPTWPAARTAGLEVPRRTGKQGAGRGVFGNEAPPIWGGRPSPNSSSAGKCSRFQNSPGLLSPLLGLPGAPQPGSSLRGSGAGQAAEGGVRLGEAGPRQPDSRLQGKATPVPVRCSRLAGRAGGGQRPGPVASRGDMASAGLGRWLRPAAERALLSSPGNWGLPPPEGASPGKTELAHSFVLPPRLRCRGTSVDGVPRSPRPPRHRTSRPEGPGGPHQPRKHRAASVTTASLGSASHAPQEPQFENPLSVGGWHLGSQRHPLPGG